jgi:methyl-accepting chemotaxis protein
LFNHRIPQHIWFMTAATVLAFCLSACAALSGGHPLLLVLSAVFAGAALAVWLLTAARYNYPISRLHDALLRGGGIPDRSLRRSAAGRAIAGELLRAKAGQVRAVRTCYSLAAVMGHARHALGLTRKEILTATAGVGSTCSQLAASLALLRGELARNEAPGLRTSGCVSANPRTGASSALEEVISSSDHMSRVLTQVNHDARELVSSAEDTTSSMARLESFLQDITRRCKDLETSTEAANRVALEGSKTFEDLDKENEAIIASVKEAGTAVDDLGRWSEEVGKIVEVIQDITDETNLLALNAAIIAAQSGEHGKAFGVVAEEIRGLAERTSSSTKEINDLVKAVQKNVSNVAQSMKKSLQSVERGDILAHKAGRVLGRVTDSFEASRGLARDIAASSFEHRIDGNEAARSVQKVADIAKRLEAGDLRDWKDGTGGMMAIRIAEVIAGVGRGRSPGAWARGPGVAPEASVLAVSTVLEEREESPGSTLERSEAALAGAKILLDSIGEKVVACVGTIEKAADLTRSLVREGLTAPVAGVVRCWEIVGCREDLREKCRAREEEDWRCFLLDEVACAGDTSSEVHGGRRCYDCPAFRDNLERILPRPGGKGE